MIVLARDELTVEIELCPLRFEVRRNERQGLSAAGIRLLQGIVRDHFVRLTEGVIAHEEIADRLDAEAAEVLTSAARGACSCSGVRASTRSQAELGRSHLPRKAVGDRVGDAQESVRDVVPRDEQAMERYAPQFQLEPAEGDAGSGPLRGPATRSLSWRRSRNQREPRHHLHADAGGMTVTSDCAAPHVGGPLNGFGVAFAVCPGGSGYSATASLVTQDVGWL